MKKLHYSSIFFIAFYLTTSLINAQQYKNIAMEDTTIWYFAHKQLSGDYIDTLFVSERFDSCYALNYRGSFYLGETKDAGQICISKNNDMIWYTPPDGNDSELVFNLNLNKEDTFYFRTLDVVGLVDSVYHSNERKIIRFDINTDWGQNISFIEGVGPSLTFIYPWYDPGFLSPLIVCKFNNKILEYSNDNPAFKDCDFFSSGISFSSAHDILLYPNPVLDIIYIKNNIHKVYTINLYNFKGSRIKTFLNSPENIPASNLPVGMYVLEIVMENQKVHKAFIKF